MATPSTSSKVSKKKPRIARVKNRLPKEEAGFRVFELGLVDYSEAWDLQKELVDKRAAEEIPDTMLLLEHPPVITRGRKSQITPATTNAQIPVLEIERGGEDTLHAPGQLVGYPILLLSEANRDLHLHMRRIEDAIIRTLADFGIEADRREGATGVWVGPRKIASIGVAFKKWVSYHGFALNVNNDLALFRAIRPCGFDPQVMTSMEKELGCPISMQAVVKRVRERFVSEFQK